MRNVIFIAIVLIVLFISAGYTPAKTTWANDVAHIKQVFNSMDIIPESYSINAWANVDNKKHSEVELKRLSSDIVDRIKVMMPSYRYDTISDQDLLGANICGKSRYGGRMLVSAQSLCDNGIRQSYVSIDADGSAKTNELNAIVVPIEQALRKYSSLNINVALWGYIKGKASRQICNRIYDQAFKMLNAEYIEGIDSESLISITAYSPAIKHYVEIKGRKANIQLAIRYNAYQDRTYIWLGVPLLTVEY